jgi:hypothetical protein
MWLSPVFLTLAAAAALLATPLPPVPVIAAFAVAIVAGGGLGYLRAQHLHLTVDTQTGEIESRATAIGTALVLLFFAARYGVKMVLPQLGAHGQIVEYAGEGLLLLTVAMLIAQTAAIWSRARPLLAAHAARIEPAVPGPEA